MIKKLKVTQQKDGRDITVEEFLALKNPKGDVIVNVDGERVSLTSLDRVYWPTEKLTKFDLLCYYLKVSSYIMPCLKDRPAILQRYPRGIKAPMFFQQDTSTAPSFIKTATLVNQEGREVNYSVYTTVGSLLHFVNLGTIEQHPWHSTLKHLDKPDYLMLDLDPKQAPWANVLKVALVCKEVLDQLGLPAFPKTSGSSGIHIYLPLKPKHDYRKVAANAEGLAAGEASEAAGLRRCDAECARQNDRRRFQCSRSRGRHRVDAADLEADRTRREDFGLHGP